MKVQVTVGAASNDSGYERYVMDLGEYQQMNLVSPWLVGAGQQFPVSVHVAEVTSQPGDKLVRADCCLRSPSTPDAQGVVIPFTHDYRMIPSERPLYAILEEAVRHGEAYPTHGSNCACMDRFLYELKRHVSRAAPIGNDQNWASTMDGRLRIRSLLLRVMRVL